ncbi:type III secretion system LEE effector EspF, partial [Escherichia coli O157]|nr:type III secretion system LEE effector EspF [Escherichia coli O157]
AYEKSKGPEALGFKPARQAPPPPTSGQASGASRPLPPIAQALKEHLAAYEKSKGPEALGFKPARQAPPPPTGPSGLPPLAQALKDHLAAYEQSKKG